MGFPATVLILSSITGSHKSRPPLLLRCLASSALPFSSFSLYLHTGYIPDALKLLARKVARAFYNDVAVVVMDMLARHTCVKEEDIRDTLQLQAKVVKMALASLETDRLVKQIDFDDPSVSIEERKRKAKYWFVDYEAVRMTTHTLPSPAPHTRKHTEEPSGWRAGW